MCKPVNTCDASMLSYTGLAQVGLQTMSHKCMQGEQVFITYGLQSNDKLLQYYGFVEAKNPADVYVIPDLLEAVRQLPHLGIAQDRMAAVQTACSKTSLSQVGHRHLLCPTS